VPVFQKFRESWCVRRCFSAITPSAWRRSHYHCLRRDHGRLLLVEIFGRLATTLISASSSSCFCPACHRRISADPHRRVGAPQKAAKGRADSAEFPKIDLTTASSAMVGYCASGHHPEPAGGCGSQLSRRGLHGFAQFCGQSCHVMHPEYTAYKISAHSHVDWRSLPHRLRRGIVLCRQGERHQAAS